MSIPDAKPEAPITSRYRAHKAGDGNQPWVVVTGGTDAEPGPVVLVGMETEKHAEDAAAVLNELVGDGQNNATLRRMLGVTAKHNDAVTEALDVADEGKARVAESYSQIKRSSLP